ncbi:hypothetical protein [Inediibacterium massiliense]|uniref:hypothetical protein n=1 Tax=Inediibacterium massiliense TaxID=1658111 RepID=UPI0006B47813|nr:hypothetical protein [Inediibacterium massiliense]
MNKKSIEDRFSQDIDNYLNGIETIHSFQSQEYNDLLELGKILDKDFSKNSNKEAVFHKTIENMNKNKDLW